MDLLVQYHSGTTTLAMPDQLTGKLAHPRVAKLLVIIVLTAKVDATIELLFYDDRRCRNACRMDT